MADFLRLSMSSQTRLRFEELLDKAPLLGIDPSVVAVAGPVALRALLALTQAKESEAGDQREHFLGKVQDALQVLEHRKPPELVQQIQKAVIAMRGRGNDTEIAHVTRGEIVVPIQLQNAEVLAALRDAAAPSGRDRHATCRYSAQSHKPRNESTGIWRSGLDLWIILRGRQQSPCPTFKTAHP